MLDIKNRFVINNYGKKPEFASFLPGISGIYGIPIWCYYVNRGQCIACFGTADKDHSIMEFSPANQAYQRVKKMGFRTFLKINDNYYEAFSHEDKLHNMNIGMNELEIEETNVEDGYSIKVNYFTLPEENVGALVRKVTIKNISDNTINVELMDGMPMIIPYGLSMFYLKDMSQTARAWLQTEKINDINTFFRVSTSIEDSTHISIVEEGNFSVCFLEDGTRLNSVTDPKALFDYDLSFDRPVEFIQNGIDGVYDKTQATKNIYPCSFYGTRKNLDIGECITFYQVIGKADNKEILEKFLQETHDSAYFECKYTKAIRYTEDICSVVETKTASGIFDAYCKQNFLDNVLRGGYPIEIAKDKVYYVYSRKHGDLERDYNYFKTSPEFYSQGNGNYRDINQNRRCDVLFAPYVGTKNIHTFFGFIQLDGYNPLLVEQVKYRLKPDYVGKAAAILNWDKELVIDELEKPYSIGALAMKLIQVYKKDEVEEKIGKVIALSEELVNGDFGEGYWCDHFTYNLDLIENYTYIYPDEEENLLFKDKSYYYFSSKAIVNKRNKRYIKTADGIQQHNAITEIESDDNNKLVRANFGEGEILYSTLIEKLVLLCVTKYATLDPSGMGIEMEGGKPGWYDALNGLPALFGSSVSETCEVCRLLDYTIKMLDKYKNDVFLLIKLKNYMTRLHEITLDYLNDPQDFMLCWNSFNYEKEQYRESILQGVSGEKIVVISTELVNILKDFRKVIALGITKAKKIGNGIIPTYFRYEVTDYKETDEGIEVLKFKQHTLPYFLEGIVRYMKLNVKDKDKLYWEVKNSDLYDSKLGMYKVNASLLDESYDIGRCRVFTPGWLENESIWLHMEYKYLLEMLKSGLYEQFGEDFHKAVVPFLNSETYGRSTLENSSFIASSKNPNEEYHGRGFVARLSGSTVEFINMWQIMMFGEKPFSIYEDELVFQLKPYIPKYLLNKNQCIETTFLGKCRIIYKFDDCIDYIPNNYIIKEYSLEYENMQNVSVYNTYIKGIIANDIRNGEVTTITVYIEQGELS